MKPFTVILFVFSAVVLGAYVSAWTLKPSLRGINQGSNISYNTASSTQTMCGISGNLVAATDTARTSFIASNNSSNTLYLCKFPTCDSTKGIVLSATSTGASPFEQNDSYTGPYSCATVTGSGTLNTVWSR